MKNNKISISTAALLKPQKSRSGNIFLSAFLILLSICLTACSSKEPEKDTAGNPWKKEWIKISSSIATESPVGLELAENRDNLAANGLFYASWNGGSSSPYENSDGETVDLYDVQLYMLVSESTNENQAKTSVAGWLSTARDSYDVKDEHEKTYGGYSFQLLTYTCNRETNPFDHGVSAFACVGSDAFCVELTCLEQYDGDLESMMEQILAGCHFAADR